MSNVRKYIGQMVRPQCALDLLTKICEVIHRN